MRHLELLARLISTSETLKTECSASDQTDLYTNYIHEYEGLSKFHPPPCVIIFPNRWTWNKQGLELDERWNPLMTIEIVKDTPTDDATGLTTRSREVMGTFTDIIAEIMAQEGKGVDFLEATQTYVGIQTLDMEEPPYRSDIAEANLVLTNPDEATQKEVWGATFSVEGF